MPHSNAEAKRSFSIVTKVKTSEKNKLSFKLLNSVCVVRCSMQNSKVSSASFIITDRHVELMRILWLEHE